MKQLLRVYLPMWLLPEVIEAPSPTTALNALLGHEITSEAWSQDLTLDDVYEKVLDYAARREQKDAQEQQDPTQRRKIAKQVVLLYRWMTLVASGIIPDEARGESALIGCLRLYRKFKDLPAARSIYHDYVERIQSKDRESEPSQRVKEVWPEATESYPPSRRPRKKTFRNTNQTDDAS